VKSDVLKAYSYTRNRPETGQHLHVRFDIQQRHPTCYNKKEKIH